MAIDTIRGKLALVPKSPGVYLFKDETDRVVYVGKAANLRSRVTSYFHSESGLSDKTRRLVSVISDIEYLITGSEQEALVLEADLIKRYRPQYNARLKDDKSFPFLKVDVSSEWPGVLVTRRKTADGAVYFGPFASARSMRQTLRLIRKAFRFRVCTGALPVSRGRPCLNMHIGLCPAPCVGGITPEEYRKTIDRIILFLQGKHRDVLDSLVDEMKEAAAHLDFERAAALRDKARAVELVTNQYGGVTALRGDQDILAVAQDRASALVDVLSVRDGRVRGRQAFPLEGVADLLPSEVLRGFVLEYYASATSVPPLLMLQHPIADARLIANWLSERRGGAVQIVVPRKGIRKQLVDNAADGVARQLAALRLSGTHGTAARESGLKELKDTLSLSGIPHRIEGFDISNLRGEEAVGSMVVFQDGVPQPSEYRRFKIRSVAGQDDYAMLHEVLGRRFARLRLPTAAGAKAPAKWSSPPSLILIDGGRGQLTAALSARKEQKFSNIPIIALAKEYEQVYSEGRTEPIEFPKDAPALLLLQAVRDEAHRFAVAYHRTLRDVSMVTSILDGVPGIGPRRRRAILLNFDSLDALRIAAPEEISRKAKIPVATAARLKEILEGGAARPDTP